MSSLADGIAWCHFAIEQASPSAAVSRTELAYLPGSVSNCMEDIRMSANEDERSNWLVIYGLASSINLSTTTTAWKGAISEPAIN